MTQQPNASGFGGLAGEPNKSLAQSMFGNQNKDNRPQIKGTFMLQKDSRNGLYVNFETMTTKMFKVNTN